MAHNTNIKFHNDICDYVVDLFGKLFTPTHIQNNPFIYAGHVVQSPKAHPEGHKTSSPTQTPKDMDHKGDLMIHELCQKGTNTVNSVDVLNTNTNLM